MSDVKKTLIAARELISDPARWTQGEAARDENGNPVFPLNEKAVCFCSIGAIEKVNIEHMTKTVSFLKRKIKGSVIDFNDTHSHAEIIAAFDAAIEAAP